MTAHEEAIAENAKRAAETETCVQCGKSVELDELSVDHRDAVCVECVPEYEARRSDDADESLMEMHRERGEVAS